MALKKFDAEKYLKDGAKTYSLRGEVEALIDRITAKEYESITSLADLGKNLGDLVVTEMPEKEFSSYYNIKGDLTAKVTELYHNYVLGNIEYEEYLNSFNKYASEIGLEEIIAEMNK